MKKTVLYDHHVFHRAKMVEYAHYFMPVEYTGLEQEHFAVRNHCGLFDVSHMGEIEVMGNDAKKFVNYIMTGSVGSPNRMGYGLMLYPHGGIIDDLMAYFFSDEHVLLVVNASNLEKDYVWIKECSKDFDVMITNRSDEISQLAFQGKEAVNILQTLTTYDLSKMQMFDFDTFPIGDHSYLVSRSGYTGEDGFEIYGKGDAIIAIFEALVDKGVALCGLGARDTLRFEANMPLYGHEIDADINPLEATLRFAVDFSKDFIGKDALLQIDSEGIKRKIVALELLERGIARSGYDVFADDKKIGYVTTGYLIPGRDTSFALAMLDAGYWDIGHVVHIQIRKNKVHAKVRNKKFLNKKYVK